jgi:hypothetical protein
MEPILIPSVPREAFNKHRRISDLIRKQVEHFKHVEARLPRDVQAKLPQHQINTEDEAARYISAMTTYLLSRPRPKPAAKKVVAIKPAVPIRRSLPVALTAAAAPAAKKSAPKKSPAKKKPHTKKKSAAKKKSAPKKETPRAKKSPSTKSKGKKSPPKRKK